MKRMKYNNGGGATYVKNIGDLETKSNIHLQGAKTKDSVNYVLFDSDLIDIVGKE